MKAPEDTIITKELLQKHAHISDEEILKDIADTEADISEAEADIKRLTIPGDKLSNYKATARSNKIVEMRDLIAELKAILTARKND